MEAVAAMSSPSSDDAREVRSPCVKVCRLDARQVCLGCGRHIEEIAGWSQLTDEQQRSICELAARRLADIAGDMMRHMPSAD